MFAQSIAFACAGLYVSGVVGPAPSNWRGRWLYELRLAQPASDGKKKLTQDEFAKKLVEKGIPLGGDPRITYVRMEKHGQFDDALMAQIAEAYGVDVPTAPPDAGASDGQALVIAAIDRQTVAIEGLTRALLLSFGELDRRSDSRSGALADMLARLEVGLLPADTEGGDDAPDHGRPRTQKKRPAGGPRPSWEEAQEFQSRGL